MLAKRLRTMLVPACLLSALVALPVFAQTSKEPQPVGAPILWRDPGNISQRNLTYGPDRQSLHLLRRSRL
jgi:hypothetical protein